MALWTYWRNKQPKVTKFLSDFADVATKYKRGVVQMEIPIRSGILGLNCEIVSRDRIYVLELFGSCLVRFFFGVDILTYISLYYILMIYDSLCSPFVTRGAESLGLRSLSSLE